MRPARSRNQRRCEAAEAWSGAAPRVAPIRGRRTTENRRSRHRIRTTESPRPAVVRAPTPNGTRHTLVRGYAQDLGTMVNLALMAASLCFPRMPFGRPTGIERVQARARRRSDRSEAG